MKIMLRLVLILFCGVLASAEVVELPNYTVTINNGELESVVPKIHSEVLDLSGLNISLIGNNAFENVTYVTDLNLSKNNLRIMAITSLYDMPKLKRVNLAKNNLFHLAHVFAGFSELEVLDIRDNNMGRLHPGSLYGLTNKTQVLFTGNKFTEITPASLQKPYDILNVCMLDNIIKFVKDLNIENFQDNRKLRCPIYLRFVNRNKAGILSEFGVTGFEKNWYQVREGMLDILDLQRNPIKKITPEFLDAIPDSMKEVYLSFENLDSIDETIKKHPKFNKLVPGSKKVDESLYAK